MRSSRGAPHCPAAPRASVPSPCARLHAAHPVRIPHTDLSRRDRDASPALCAAADAVGRPRRRCCATNLAAARTPLSGSVPNRQRMARITSPRVISGTGWGETLQGRACSISSSSFRCSGMGSCSDAILTCSRSSRSFLTSEPDSRRLPANGRSLITRQIRAGASRVPAAGVISSAAKVCTAMRIDPTTLASRDPQRMMDLIMRFPRMCEEAWALAPLGGSMKSPQAVVALGMGGSGIGGDLLRAVVFEEATVPVASIKEYRAPAFVGPQTLVFACSYSGETEETLAAYDEAVQREAPCVVITSGGELLWRAQVRRHTAIVVPKGLPPRAALPYLFLPMLAMLSKIGVGRRFGGGVREAGAGAAAVAAEHGPDGPDTPP